MSAYVDREQTQAKHDILRGYLMELAYKVLRHQDIAYVDGFSGPWESTTTDFSDTSFMIAIAVLKEAQHVIYNKTNRRRKIRCFFSEKNLSAYQQMNMAVASFHRPDIDFEVKTFQGEFADAVSKIREFIGTAFPLIFIDPTGWTEYPFAKITPLFNYRRCEVLINFMYGHISRFLSHPDESVIASFDHIFGGPGWQSRLDPALKKGPAAVKLFCETLKTAGNFQFVVTTRIDKSTEERPHFFLAYGTKNRAGLIAFRDIEYAALRRHAKNRSAAMTRKRDKRANTPSLFPDFDAQQKEASIEVLVDEQKIQAKQMLHKMLSIDHEGIKFAQIVDATLESFMLRETDVKDVCVELANNNIVENTWGASPRKPDDNTVIRPKTAYILKLE